MRSKFLATLLIAGTVAACASTPPPAPMMAEAPPPPPPPAPVMMGPMSGVFRGTAELAADAPKSCHKMSAHQTVRVRNSMFYMAGLHAKIGPDGMVTAPKRHGTSLTGTASDGALDLMLMQGKCSYHYTLASPMKK